MPVIDSSRTPSALSTPGLYSQRRSPFLSAFKLPPPPLATVLLVFLFVSCGHSTNAVINSSSSFTHESTSLRIESSTAPTTLGMSSAEGAESQRSPTQNLGFRRAGFCSIEAPCGIRAYPLSTRCDLA